MATVGLAVVIVASTVFIYCVLADIRDALLRIATKLEDGNGK